MRTTCEGCGMPRHKLVDCDILVNHVVTDKLVHMKPAIAADVHNKVHQFLQQHMAQQM